MSAPLQPARLDWSQGLPFSADFNDVYFSTAGGDSETRHVFLNGNQLEDRFKYLSPEQSFTIIETGFGTGLNWLCTQTLWQECGRNGWLHIVSIEKHPLQKPDLLRAQALWPCFEAYARALQENYPELVTGFHRLVFPELRSTLTLVFSDIEEVLPLLSAQADAWYLDGFAPSRNPEMWQASLFHHMARLSKPNATFATFTAAGDVRRGLQQAGFEVSKSMGYGKKREMLKGVFSGNTEKSVVNNPWFYRPALSPATLQKKEAIVIGAGIAGTSTAHALAQRGWKVTVLEKHNVADGASGNPAAIIALTPASSDTVLTHFPQQAGLHALRTLTSSQAPYWHPCGVLELPTSSHQKTFSGDREVFLPKTLHRSITAEQASEISGVNILHAAVWQPRSGWLEAKPWCQHSLQHPDITVIENCEVTELVREQDSWLVKTNSEKNYQCPVVIIANSYSVAHLLPDNPFFLRVVRGQISRVPPAKQSSDLKTVVCERGYISPPDTSGLHCVGASFIPDDTETDIRLSEHQEMRSFINNLFSEWAHDLSPCESWQGRSGLRCQSEDYLPLIGPLAERSTLVADYEGLRHGKRLDYPLLKATPNLYVNLAYGSHGFTAAMLGAEIIASELNDEPAPCSAQTLESLHPMRFAIRRLKRQKI